MRCFHRQASAFSNRYSILRKGYAFFSDQQCRQSGGRGVVPVCTENLVLFDYLTESPNVSGDGRAALLLPDPVRLVCVPKTSSVLIARPNRLNVSGDDRALLAPPGPVRLTVQVKERTCGRERCAPTSIDCAAAEGARSRSTHEWGSLVLGHAISMVSIGPQ